MKLYHLHLFLLIGLPALVDPQGVHLQHMLTICGRFAREHMLEYGFEKTKAVVFRPSESFACCWTLQCMSGARPREVYDVPHDAVRLTTAYKYLGVLFAADTKWTQHIEQVVLPKI